MHTPNQLGKLCRIDALCGIVPADATCSFERDPQTIEIDLKALPATSILIGHYEIPPDRRSDIGAWLRERMEYFIEHCAFQTTKQRPHERTGVSAEQWQDKESGYLVCQGVARERWPDRETWWLARLMSRPPPATTSSSTDTAGNLT